MIVCLHIRIYLDCILYIYIYVYFWYDTVYTLILYMYTDHCISFQPVLKLFVMLSPLLALQYINKSEIHHHDVYSLFLPKYEGMMCHSFILWANWFLNNSHVSLETFRFKRDVNSHEHTKRRFAKTKDTLLHKWKVSLDRIVSLIKVYKDPFIIRENGGTLGMEGP